MKDRLIKRAAALLVVVAMLMVAQATAARAADVSSGQSQSGQTVEGGHDQQDQPADAGATKDQATDAGRTDDGTLQPNTGQSPPPGPGQNPPPDPGSSQQPPPKPKPEKCKCINIVPTIRVPNVGAYMGTFHTWFPDVWYAMNCTNGRRSDCKGEIKLGKPSIGVIPEAGKVVKCVSYDCKTIVGRFGFRLRIRYADYRNKTISVRIPISVRCASGVWTTITATMVIKKGVFNKGASDLDGDGRSDGSGRPS